MRIFLIVAFVTIIATAIPASSPADEGAFRDPLGGIPFGYLEIEPLDKAAKDAGLTQQPLYEAAELTL